MRNSRGRQGAITPEPEGLAVLWRGAALSLLGLPLAAGAQAVAPQADVAEAEPYRVSITVRSGQQSIFDIAGSADRVSARDIRLDQAQVQFSESLAGVPGLLIRDRQNFAQDLQLSIRGFGARSTFGVRGVRLYVDGIPATLPDGQGQTSNIDLGSADRVEVLRGPFSALYGNSSGGVVQVFTEDGSGPPRVEAGSYFGAHDTTRTGAKISGSNDRISYVLSGSHFHTDGWREHSRADRDLFNAKLGFDLGGGDKLTLVGNYVNVKAQDPGGLNAAQVQENPRQTFSGDRFNTHKNVEQTQFGLTWDKHVGSNSRLQLMAYGGRRNMEQFLPIPPAAQQNNVGHSGGVVGFVRDYYGLDARWTTQTELASRPFEWTAGLAWDSLCESRTGHENFVGAEEGRRGLLRRDERNTVRSLDPYAQASWQLASRWRLDAGVRRSRVRFSSQDHYVINGDDSYASRYVKWLPTAALRFEPNERWAFYGAVGRGYETPTLNELAYQAGAGGVNTDLRPSSNLSYELGVKGFVAGGWLTAAVFQTNTTDEIVTLKNDNGRAFYQNAGRTRRRGFELSWDHQTPSYWRTQLAYTYLDARYRDGFCSPCAPDPKAEFVPGGRRIPGIPAHALYAAFGWLPPQGWHAGAELRVLSRVYANDFNTASAAGHATVALHAGYTHRAGPWELNAFARVDNVLDRRVIGSVIVNDGNGRYFEPSPGRVWGVGLNASYRF